MELLLITRPVFFSVETSICNELFSKGLQRLHLRKPKATRQEVRKWLKEINPTFLHRIVLHDYHELVLDYPLGGIHLNSRNSNVPKWLNREHFTLSRSCHSIKEVEDTQKEFDYVFLSPIFDSISKQGYKAAFSKKQLEEAKTQGLLSNVYALGGITFENLQKVEQLGFAGAAMLGGFWENYKVEDKLLRRIEENT